MEYRLATKNDIGDVLSLHRKYHVDTVSDADRADGFVTTLLNEDLLLELIEKEDGLAIARKGAQLTGFVMSASWQYCSKWPMFQHMISQLGELEYLGQRLSTENSYQYGPICIHRDFRGTGVLEGLFDFARSVMERRFPILVTFVNKENPRSVKAHVDKLKLEVIKEFEYNKKSYLELVYDTSKPLS